MAWSVVSRAAGLGALTAAGQIVLIGSLPIYSRLFSPASYGEYVIFVGTAAVVSVLAGLRYDSAIVLPREERLAYGLSGLVVCIAATVVAIIAIATLLVSVWPSTVAARWLGIERHFGFGLAAATGAGALQRCLASWCIRNGRFLRLGTGQFVLSLATVLVQLWLVRMTGELAALIWGYVCALALQAACLAAPSTDARHAHWRAAFSPRAMRIAARRYRRFPAYMVGYALASSARERLVQIILGIGAGAAVVGRFGLAYRVAFAPNSLIYSALSPVFYAIASRGARSLVGRFAAELVEATFVVLIVPYVAFALESPMLTERLLSERWQGTAPYLQALAGPALLLATTCWLDRAFDSFRRQNIAFSLEASFTLLSVVLIASLAGRVDPVSIAWAYAGAALFYYWTYFLTTFTACGFPLEDFRHACFSGALASACALGLGALAHRIHPWTLRLAAYALVMGAVLLMWIRLRNGAAILRSILDSRVGGDGFGRTRADM